MEQVVSVIVVAHDPEWAQRFESEAQLIHATLGPAVSGLYHIGSTAIPGIYAKPVIDILAEVTVVEAIDDRTQLLVDQGSDFSRILTCQVLRHDEQINVPSPLGIIDSRTEEIDGGIAIQSPDGILDDLHLVRR